MNEAMVALTIGLSAAVTIALRFLPFIIFSGKKEIPRVISYLGKYLPYAIMAMLVVYCLKSVNLLAAPFGIPELIGVVSVVLLHLWRRNTLISIAGGTVIYMLLIRFVF